jgi:hypothetical protein
MPNPFNVLNPSNPMRAYQGNMGNIQALYQAIMGGGNPMQAFQRIASQNPQLQPIMQAIRGGANPRQLFNTLCQQRGINPQEFMRQITGNNAF